MRSLKKRLRVFSVRYQGTTYSVPIREQATVSQLRNTLAEQLLVPEKDQIVMCEGKRLKGNIQVAAITGPVELIACSEHFVWLVTKEQQSYVRVEQLISSEFRDLQLFYKGVALDLANLSAYRLGKRAKVLGLREGEQLVRVNTVGKCHFLIGQSCWTVGNLKLALSPKAGVEPWRLRVLSGTQTLQNEAELRDLDLRLLCPGEVFVSISNSRRLAGTVHLGSDLSDRLIAEAALLLNTAADSTLLVYKYRPIAPHQSLLRYGLEVGSQVEAYTERDKVVFGRFWGGEVVCGLAASTPGELRLELGLEPCIRLIYQGRVLEETETLRLPAGCTLDLARPLDTLFPVRYASGHCQIAILPKFKSTAAGVMYWLSRRSERSVRALKLCRAGRILADDETVSPTDVLEVLKDNDVLVRVESILCGNIHICLPERALVADLKERIRVKTGISVASQRLYSYTWLEDQERLDFYSIVAEARVYLKMPTDLFLSAHTPSRTLLVLASPAMPISSLKEQIREQLECLGTLRLAVEGVELREERVVGDYGLGEDCRVEIVQKGDRVVRLDSPTEENLLLKLPSQCESLADLHAFIEKKTSISAQAQHLLWSGCLQSARTLLDYQMTGESIVSLIRRPSYSDEVRISLKSAYKRKFSVKISLSSPVSLLRKLGKKQKKTDPTILVIPEDVVLQDNRPLCFYDLKAHVTVQIADPAEAVVTVVESEGSDSWAWLVRKESTIGTLKMRISKYPASIQILSLMEQSLSDETFVSSLGINPRLQLSLRPGTVLLLQPKQPSIVLSLTPDTLEDLQHLIEHRTGISRIDQRLYHRDQLVLNIDVFNGLSEAGICLQLLSIRTDIRLKLVTASGTVLYAYASLSDSIELTKQAISKQVGLSAEVLDLAYSTELNERNMGLLGMTEEKQVELKVREGGVWVLVDKCVKVLRVEEGETLQAIREKADLLCGRTGLQLCYNGLPLDSADLPLLALVHAN